MTKITKFQAQSNTQCKAKRIAIFVSFSGQGGVEKMMLNLAGGLSMAGYPVDLVTVKSESAYLQALPNGVQQVNLKVSHTFGSLFFLMAYLRKQKPAALLAAKDRANIVAVLARKLASPTTRLVVRMGTTVSAAVGQRRRLKKKLWYLRMRVFYPFSDMVVAVSEGVACDLRENAHLSNNLITVIPNPVVTPQLLKMADEQIDHPWFKKGELPVVLGVGRLTRQKDFSTLIRAFAKMRADIPSRLMILGEGRNRHELESLARQLGVFEDTDLPGFIRNPYPYMKRAALFVLSSAWEGSPNALTEALALGTPVVSTDCPNGPREILQGGKFGKLVPVGDASALSRAMMETLSNPPQESFLQLAAKPYTLKHSSRLYLEALLGKP